MSNIEKDLTPTIEDEDTFSIDDNEEMLIMEAALLMGGNGNTDVGRMTPRQNKRQSAVVAPRRSIIRMPRNKSSNNLRRRRVGGLNDDVFQKPIPRTNSKRDHSSALDKSHRANISMPNLSYISRSKSSLNKMQHNHSRSSLIGSSGTKSRNKVSNRFGLSRKSSSSMHRFNDSFSAVRHVHSGSMLSASGSVGGANASFDVVPENSNVVSSNQTFPTIAFGASANDASSAAMFQNLNQQRNQNPFLKLLSQSQQTQAASSPCAQTIPQSLVVSQYLALSQSRPRLDSGVYKQDRATNRLSLHVSDEDLLMQTARLMQQRQNRRDSESIPRRRASVQRLAEKAKRKTSDIAEGQESLLINQKNVTNSTQDTKRTPMRPFIKRKTSDIEEDQNSNEDTNRTARRSSVTTRVTSNEISQTRADEELNHQTPVLQQPKNCNASNHFHVPSFGWLGNRGGTFRDIASMSLVFLACLMAVTQVKTHIATSEIRTVKVSLII